MRASAPANRGFQFRKRSQDFIGSHNETLSVASMCVSNPDCSPLGILCFAVIVWSASLSSRCVAATESAFAVRSGSQANGFYATGIGDYVPLSNWISSRLVYFAGSGRELARECK